MAKFEPGMGGLARGVLAAAHHAAQVAGFRRIRDLPAATLTHTGEDDGERAVR
jgi:hypothetical protein